MFCLQGNHEDYNNAFFMRYLNQTAGIASRTPRRASDISGDASGRWYSVDIGLVHLVVLDFNVYYTLEPDAVRVAQLAWLAKDLAAVDRTATPWLIATGHMPMQVKNSVGV